MPQKINQRKSKKYRKGIKKFSISNFLGGVGSAIAVISFVIIFLPRIGIEMNGPADPYSLKSNAIITNNGLLTLRDVKVMEGQGYFAFMPPHVTFEETEKISGPETHDADDFKQAYGEADWNIKKLPTDEKFTITFEEPFEHPGYKIFRAHVAIIVTYKLWFWPFRFERQQRFWAKHRQDGRFDWLYE